MTEINTVIKSTIVRIYLINFNSLIDFSNLAIALSVTINKQYSCLKTLRNSLFLNFQFYILINSIFKKTIWYIVLKIHKHYNICIMHYIHITIYNIYIPIIDDK